MTRQHTLTSLRIVLPAWLLAASLGAASLGAMLPGARAQTPVAASAPTAAPKVVPLTPDTCAQVSDGDTLTFEWNPSFDAPAAGLQNFEMSFVREEETWHLSRTSPQLQLAAIARDLRHPRSADAITALPNSLFQMRFFVDATRLTPGVYRLVQAEATATRYANVPDAPHMTNSPLRYPFCVEILPANNARTGAR